MMIEISNLNKSYTVGQSTLQVLKNISLKVEKGEFLSIVGASGSGKSTLMNIIGCMDRADSGSYFLEGIAVHDCDSRQAAQIRNEKIGFVFQKYHLIPQYSIFQNVLMPLLIRGMTTKQAAPLVWDALERVGLADRKDHRPCELSGGQQQRAAIARALITQPALLLADEPTGALDSKTGQEILSLFQQLNAQGNTIIQITHDLHVAQYAHRIVRLSDGVLEY